MELAVNQNGCMELENSTDTQVEEQDAIVESKKVVNEASDVHELNKNTDRILNNGSADDSENKSAEKNNVLVEKENDGCETSTVKDVVLVTGIKVDLELEDNGSKICNELDDNPRKSESVVEVNELETEALTENKGEDSCNEPLDEKLNVSVNNELETEKSIEGDVCDESLDEKLNVSENNELETEKSIEKADEYYESPDDKLNVSVNNELKTEKSIEKGDVCDESRDEKLNVSENNELETEKSIEKDVCNESRDDELNVGEINKLEAEKSTESRGEKISVENESKKDQQQENNADSTSELFNDSLRNKKNASPDQPFINDQDDVISIKDNSSNSSFGDDCQSDADDEASRDMNCIKSAARISKESTKKIDVKNSEKSKDQSKIGKSVEKMTVDGDEFLITINEDDDDENLNDVEKSCMADKNNSNKNEQSKSSDKPAGKESLPHVSSSQKQSISSGIHPITVADTPSSQAKITVSRTLTPHAVMLPQGMTANQNMMQYYVPTASHAMNSVVRQALGVPQHTTNQGYVTKVGNQTVYVPFSRQPSTIPSQYVTAGMTRTTFLPASATGRPPASYLPQKATNPHAVSKYTQPELIAPQSSLDQISMIAWEIKMRKVDNSNWAGNFPIKPQADLGTVTKFLLDLGHDVVKESVYKDIVAIQTVKEVEGGLTEKQKDNLKEMKDVLSELKNKVGHTHLRSSQKCGGCGFHSESSNVLYLHKQQPHLRPRWDSASEMLCAFCDFRTKLPQVFSFHMEAEHHRKAHILEKRAFFECNLCGFDNVQKGRMTQHKLKCNKHFRLCTNLSPFYSDANFCLKNTFYFKRNIEKLKTVSTRQAPVKPISIQPRPVPPQKIIRPSLQGSKQYQVMPPTAAKPRPLLTQVSIPPGMKTNVQSNTVRAQLQKIQLQHRQKGSLVQQIQSQSRPQPKNQQTSGAGFEVCELCGGFVKDRAALHVHFYYAHKVSIPQKIFERPQAPLFCRVCMARFWTAQGLTKHKSSANHRDVSTNKPMNTGKTKCWICLQCPDNIVYHMQSVHGMSFNDLLAQEKCVFCGISIGSKKSMELHMSAAHGVIVKGDTWTGRAVTGGIGPVKPAQPAEKPAVGATPTTNQPQCQNMVRNNFCVFCGISFTDNAQLTLHCIKRHATCRECGMVVARSADLANHSCTRRLPKTCVICGLRNLKAQYYNKHVLTHLKNCKVKLKRLTNEDIVKASKRPLENCAFAKTETKRAKVVAETVVLDISSSDEGESKTITRSSIKKIGSTKKQDSVDEKHKPVSDQKSLDNKNIFPKDVAESDAVLGGKNVEAEEIAKKISLDDTKSKISQQDDNNSVEKLHDDVKKNELVEEDEDAGKDDSVKNQDEEDGNEDEKVKDDAMTKQDDVGQDDSVSKDENASEDKLDVASSGSYCDKSMSASAKETADSTNEKPNVCEDMSDDDLPKKTPVKNMKIQLNVEESSSEDESEDSSGSKGKRKRKLDNDTSAFCIKRRK